MSPKVEKYENLIIGSGVPGRLMAWTMGEAGHRTALVERKTLGGSCHNVACLPSKNIINSAKVISLAKRGLEFGLKFDALSLEMKDVQRRKRLMVEEVHQLNLKRTAASGAELIMGNARFSGPHTVESICRAAGEGPYSVSVCSWRLARARQCRTSQDWPKHTR